ncbi:class I SAM-dependent methyltransferase [Spirochaeta africana]|uniref:Methylase involved in ubiquinone/menaquinone biosynthesis n=1 Tax=Spirochaeta africana (strain ATCC 700263 / DSM 8902 / Z-7692) TaxID=889378 RepID=H9UHT8_SPIAZ|nr:class I SAM-dependent methyltransferase [Spirochaeta africana]AFG37081.1 methylase involved in ubiquinone/menaquinone biosynthesis [Spirochaeta africana DSM 8902]
MPSMYEIYDHHAAEYDQLVTAEDYQGNLRRVLHELHDFTGQSVIELGAGTGRLTRMYVDSVQAAYCADRSTHMLQTARRNLSDYLDRITFATRDNLDAPGSLHTADVVLEGWAFGHTIYDYPDRYLDTMQTLVDNCEKMVRPGGKVIIIETLGTNLEQPEPPGELLTAFYDYLETVRGYQRTVVSTDYRFASVAEACRVMGFFFGDAMLPGIQARNSTIIPEFTGIWSRSVL